MAYNSETDKIDKLATDGLTGTNNSLAYRTHEIEKHFHSEEHWYGTDGDGSGSTANNLTPWNLVAGSSEAYGTEVLLLAANDISNADFTFTPVKFDMHRIFVEASSINDQTFIIQLWGGTGIFSAATYLTEVPYRAAGSATESVPIDIQMSRQAVANKIWARVKCQSNGQDLDITVGVHAYVG